MTEEFLESDIIFSDSDFDQKSEISHRDEEENRSIQFYYNVDLKEGDYRHYYNKHGQSYENMTRKKEAKEEKGKGKKPSGTYSMPMKIPERKACYQHGMYEWAWELEEDEERLPPHEIVAKRMMRSLLSSVVCSNDTLVSLSF